MRAAHSPQLVAVRRSVDRIISSIGNQADNDYILRTTHLPVPTIASANCQPGELLEDGRPR
jgi:hypothetical protein